ncbi:MAG: protein kinase [Gemmataceae bacterium]
MLFIPLSRNGGLKELRAMGRVRRLRHPNLVPVLGVWLRDTQGNTLGDSDPGQAPSFQMAGDKQLVLATGPGNRTLGAVLARYQAHPEPDALPGGLGLRRLLKYMQDAAAGIDYLNIRDKDRGGNGAVEIIHCDIKPGNLLLVNGRVQVCYHGWAKALDSSPGQDARTTMAAGTAAYAAPELINNEPGEWTDQYCLAITYYELRTGTLPFPEHRALQAHLLGVLDFDGVSEPEREVLKRATAMQPDKRFPTCTEFVEALYTQTGTVDFGDNLQADPELTTGSGEWSVPPSKTMAWSASSDTPRDDRPPLGTRNPGPRYKRSDPPTKPGSGKKVAAVALIAVSIATAALIAAVRTAVEGRTGFAWGFALLAVLALAIFLLRTRRTTQEPQPSAVAPSMPDSARESPDGSVATLPLGPPPAGSLTPASPPTDTTLTASPDLFQNSTTPYRPTPDRTLTQDVGAVLDAGRSPDTPTRTLTHDPLNVLTAAHAPPRTLTVPPGDPAPLPGLAPVLDKYAIVRHLGEGSFGTVFLAHPKGHPDKPLAIKFFVYGSTRRWRLLQAEVQRLADLGGVSGIVQLLDVNADADPPHFVMPFAEGGSLADRVRRDGSLSAAAVAGLAGQIAGSLAGVHNRGVVHCDLKPANILLDAADRPLLADFGQAQLVGGRPGPGHPVLHAAGPGRPDPGRRTRGGTCTPWARCCTPCSPASCRTPTTPSGRSWTTR